MHQSEKLDRFSPRILSFWRENRLIFIGLTILLGFRDPNSYKITTK
jgi:hypothetical protein